MTPQYLRLSILLAIKFAADLPFDCYIKLSDQKYIKLAGAGGDMRDVLAKYETKGIEDVWLTPKDYNHFMNIVQNKLQGKFFQPGTKTEEDTVDILDKSYEMVKQTFSHLGISEESVQLAKQVAQKSMQVLDKTPNIFQFMEQFQKQCSGEYLRAMLVGYTCNFMIDAFPWQSEAVKEKLSLASMLVDVTLDPHDFKNLKENLDHPLLMTEKVKNHPKEIGDLLEESGSAIPKEVICIVREHHELPTGKGFPYGLDHSRINMLSAVYIIGSNFVDMMVEKKFDYRHKDEIISKINQKFRKGNYRKAANSLSVIFSVA